MAWLRVPLAALLALGATWLVLAGVLALNRPVPPPPPPKEVKEVSFDVQQRAKPPQTKKEPPPRRTRPKAVAPPTDLLAASLSGLSFGLDSFQNLVAASGSALEGGEAGSVVMTEATVDEPPKAVERRSPEYPVRARSKGIQGTVNLSVLIGEDGVVRDVSVIEADPPGVFDDVAREALRGWRFQPAMYQGRPVPIRVQQLLRFALE